MTNIDDCLGDQATGFMLGILLCRYILQGMGHTQEVADTINHQSLYKYLAKLASGDLVIQDQVLSGREFDPETESDFQKIAAQVLDVLNQAKEESDESIWWNTSGPEENS